MKISIITAVYNRRDTIQKALDCVAHQSYSSIEHVVVDGASNDGTLQILEEQRSRLAALVSEPDNGIYDALNKGIALTSGEVVGFLHADDVLASRTVIERIAKIFDDPTFDAAYGDLVYVSQSDPQRIIRHWRAGQFSLDRLKWGWMPPHPTLYVRRSLFEACGCFDARFRIAADYDWMLRVLSQPHVRLAYIPEVLVRMRLGGASNRSLANMIRKSREDYLALRKNRIGGLGALAWKNLSKIGQYLV